MPQDYSQAQLGKIFIAYARTAGQIGLAASFLEDQGLKVTRHELENVWARNDLEKRTWGEAVKAMILNYCEYYSNDTATITRAINLAWKPYSKAVEENVILHMKELGLKPITSNAIYGAQGSRGGPPLQCKRHTAGIKVRGRRLDGNYIHT